MDAEAPAGGSNHDDDPVVAIVSQTHVVEEEIVVTTETTADGTVIDVVEVDLIEVDVIDVDVMDVDEVQVDGVEIDVISVDAGLASLDDDEDHVPTQGALPLDVRTGDAGVDAAVGQLRALDDLPVSEHAEVFTAVHRALQDALVDLDRN